MKTLDTNVAMEYIALAAEAAKNATCKRSRCGSVIIKEGEVLAVGYNTPPKELETQRRCAVDKKQYHKKVSDKSCCVHAEEVAIMKGLAMNAEKLPGSTLYFVRIDDNDKPKPSGNPWCTICSKMALHAGIAEFVLMHKDKIIAYDTDEYNDLSYRYAG